MGLFLILLHPSVGIAKNIVMLVGRRTINHTQVEYRVKLGVDLAFFRPEVLMLNILVVDHFLPSKSFVRVIFEASVNKIETL